MPCGDVDLEEAAVAEAAVAAAAPIGVGSLSPVLPARVILRLPPGSGLVLPVTKQLHCSGSSSGGGGSSASQFKLFDAGYVRQSS